MQIHEINVSFVWFQSVPGLLFEPARPAQAPLSFLGRSWAYESEFDRLRAGGAPDRGVSLPWPHPAGQRFWTFYLGSTDPGSLRPHAAWKQLVPFRWLIDRPQLAAPPGRVIAEALFYPHGLSLILTARLQPGLDLDGTVDACVALRRGKPWSHTPPGAGTPTNATLNALAGWLLESARVHGFGGDAEVGPRTVDPFSVATVVRADGTHAEARFLLGGTVHRALETLTSWSRLPPGAPPPELDKETRREQELGKVLFVRPRGRAVWHPNDFLARGHTTSRLSCYHRNLVLCVAQVEALAGLMQDARDCMERGHALSASYRDCARHAAGILGRLQGGHSSTYTTRSARAQIAHAGYDIPANTVRQSFGMKPLLP